jgi:hypothetical protein
MSVLAQLDDQAICYLQLSIDILSETYKFKTTQKANLASSECNAKTAIDSSHVQYE